VGTAAPATGAPTLPRGFVLRDTATGQGAYNLTDFGYLPDGSVLTTGKNGRVTWVPVGGTPKVIATLPTDSTWDLGLVGLGIPPDYALTRHVYLVRAVPGTTPPYRIRLSRFTVQGADAPTGLGEEKTLFEVLAPDATHGMTSVIPDPDGSLWVSVGDMKTPDAVSVDALKTLDLDQPAGKLLHITADGAGVPSNPYYDPARPTAWRSRVYASGFRSPFRLSLNPGTGTPVVGDVGWNTWEEVDLVAPGQNYQWPCWEGPVVSPGYTDLPACAHVTNTPPLWSYHHGSASNQGNSVTGGTVYTGSSYPAQYQGAYFFGDYTRRKLWTMRFDSTGKLVTAPQDPPFATDIGGPVRFQAAANGDIVYADIVSGSLRRLSYSPGNTAPVAKATTTTDPDTRTVSFDGTDSVDFDGDALSYTWDFGDGATGQGAKVQHTYSGAQSTLTATLTIKDSLGATDATEITVAPSNHSPTLDVTTPGDVTFAVNDPVTLSATATDAEDGALQVQWTDAVVHCPQAATCHAHPGQGSTGDAFQAPFPDHPNSHLEVTATVQDSAGVQVSRTYEAIPRLHRLTLTSNVPALLQMPAQSGSTTDLVTEGAEVDVRAADVAQDGVATFDRWMDGATERSRTVTMDSSDLTLTAGYLTPIDRRYNGEPALQALLGSAVGPEIAEGRVHHRDFQHGALYWSAAAGVHEIHGAIRTRFMRSGAQDALGAPLGDEAGTADGLGRYGDFSKDASIYWTARTGAHVVRGAIRQRWRDLDAEAGVLGYPVTGQRKNGRKPGAHTDFARNGGAIYWSKATGAHELYGPIAKRWTKLGGPRSSLGLPTTGVEKVKGGLRSAFQHGSIRWYSSTGRTVVRVR
jgi:glucose/arabinose dehydrogenase